MTPKELTIGNWIIDRDTCPKNGIYFQIEEIKKRDGVLGFVYNNGNCWSTHPKQVPLTEAMFDYELFEISNAYGIHEGMAKMFSYIDSSETDIDFVHYNGKFYFYKTTYGNNWGYIQREVKYLHEIQNIINSLTETEFTLNPNTK